MTNQDIAKLLRHVAAAYSVKDEKKYRFQIIAYQKASDAIEGSTVQIKDLIKEKKLVDVSGIGTTMKAHLKELITTGKVKHFAQVLQDVPQAMFPLLDVPSFGPKKAFKLVDTFQLKDPKTVYKDVAHLAKIGKIAQLEGFGVKSQADILRALSEFKEGKGKTTRMVLPFATELAKDIQAYLQKSEFILKAEPLGSLRRKKATIGDLDFAVATKEPEKAIEYFLNYPYKERIIEKGPMSAAMLARGGRQVDLLTVVPESFGSLLQHFTGSKNHNVHLRELALRKSMSLSERGIKRIKNGRELLERFDTEEKFYQALGMDWIEPELREDTGEIERALLHKLPQLVKITDMKGDLHIHSSFPIEPSHDMGASSMEDMLVYAKKLGYEYVGFSEHNPSISRHTKEEVYALIAKKKNKIEHLNKSKKYIRVFNMLEVDILPSGDLAIDNKSADLLDAFLVSIHSVFSMDKKTMTKRILSGLSHPKAKILTHPTGRMLNDRPGYEVDFDEVFAFCKENNKAIEINAWPQRLDLPDILVKEAVILGVKLVIDSDSHALEHMDNLRYGVSVARRGWAEKSNIINTLRVEEFEKWIKT